MARIAACTSQSTRPSKIRKTKSCHQNLGRCQPQKALISKQSLPSSNSNLNLSNSQELPKRNQNGDDTETIRVHHRAAYEIEGRFKAFLSKVGNATILDFATNGQIMSISDAELNLDVKMRVRQYCKLSKRFPFCFHLNLPHEKSISFNTRFQCR
jgi:hypothetical protein